MEFETGVISNENLTERVFLLTVERPENFSFKAGQFVMLVIGEDARAFSLSNSEESDRLEFLIRYHEDGKFTPKLKNLRKGDKLKISGPYGSFTLKGEPPYLFIAIGTGIAPIRSLIHKAVSESFKSTLLFGFREKFFFKEEFENLKEKGLRLEYFSTLLEGEHGGRITPHIERIAEGHNTAFVCGSREMVEDVLKKLEDKNIEIFKEGW